MRGRDERMSSTRILLTLQSLSKLPNPGPAPAFTHVHVSQAVLTIGDEGQIGRIELSRRLGIGEGAVRTLIKHLLHGKIIKIAKEGCALTRSGLLLYSSLRSRISKVRRVDARQLALDKATAGLLIRSSGRRVRRGIEQRDAAVKAGATGACTLVYKRLQFLMPMSEGEEWKLTIDDELFQDLRSTFSPKENDVVVLSSGPDNHLAEQGAMAAALTLVA